MGVFSVCCAKTHLPVLIERVWGEIAPHLCEVVVLQKYEETFTGAYDGYGFGLANVDNAKFVLRSAYAGETWEDVPDSGYEPNQGLFHNKSFIRVLAEHPGFKSHNDYLAALSDFEVDEVRRVAAVLADMGLRISDSLVPDVHVLLLQAAELAAEPDAQQSTNLAALVEKQRALLAQLPVAAGALLPAGHEFAARLAKEDDRFLNAYFGINAAL